MYDYVCRYIGAVCAYSRVRGSGHVIACPTRESSRNAAHAWIRPPVPSVSCFPSACDLSPCVSACDGLHLQRVANVCQNIPPVPASFQGTGEAIAQARLDDGDEESSP